MRVNLSISSLCLATALCWTAVPVSAQYEGLGDFPDAPTRSKDKEGAYGTLEGVQLVKKGGSNEGLRVHFLLTEKPSAYFNYYDPSKKAIVFDFYDTRMGESVIDPIVEPPITNSTVEFFKLDLNKDVVGLKPDIRDVVRVTMFTRYDLEYDLLDDVGVVTMAFKWNKKVQKALSRGNPLIWQFPLALAALGGAGYATYVILKPEEAAPPAELLPDPPPAHPE